MTGKRRTYWKNRRVLITGHEGFIGSWLTKTLLGYGAKIVGIDKLKNRPISMLKGLRRDISSIKGNLALFRTAREVIEKYRPRSIFHLAAESIVGEANRNPIRTFKSNIEGTWNILEACREKGFIESIIIASSDKAYGETDNLPYLEGMDLFGSHPYDVSKSCADLLAYTYYNTYHLPVGITRCGNVIGPGDFHFSRIVPDAVRSALQDKRLLVRSDGTFTRDYVYIEDIIEGYILLAEKIPSLGLAGEVFNFSGQRPISVVELVKKIYRAVNKKPAYRILGGGEYEIKDQYLSSKKARDILGWRPRYSLEQALSITIDWYKQFF